MLGGATVAECTGIKGTPRTDAQDVEAVVCPQSVALGPTSLSCLMLERYKGSAYSVVREHRRSISGWTVVFNNRLTIQLPKPPNRVDPQNVLPLLSSTLSICSWPSARESLGKQVLKMDKVELRVCFQSHSPRTFFLLWFYWVLIFKRERIFTEIGATSGGAASPIFSKLKH